MEILKVPISEVEVWKDNPRNIKTEDFERLKRQIQELGVYKPLVCIQENGKYITLGGNMRLRALQVLNFKEVDISIVEAKTEAMKIKYALSDNDRAGEYDEQKLAELVYPHLDEIRLEDFKIDVGEPITLKDVIEEFGPSLDGREDEIPEIDDSPAITKMGDLFTLGKHRLLCGDATKEEDVKRLMNGKKADMVFTDPPYGIDLDTDWSNLKGSLKAQMKGKKGGRIYNKIINDDKSFNPYFLLQQFNYVKEIFLWGADYYHHFLPQEGCFLVWDKRLSKQADEAIGSSFELCWSKTQHKKYIVRIFWCGAFGVKPEDKKRYHPTQKPVELAIWFIKKFSKDNQIILDVFLGSGTTLIACEKLNRICYGMEIEPKYCDIVITRFSNFTGIPEEEIRETVEHGQT
jgi:DNA modification methylase